jgi:phosphate-selective porin OprO and OprP
MARAVLRRGKTIPSIPVNILKNSFPLLGLALFSLPLLPCTIAAAQQPAPEPSAPVEAAPSSVVIPDPAPAPPAPTSYAPPPAPAAPPPEAPPIEHALTVSSPPTASIGPAASATTQTTAQPDFVIAAGKGLLLTSADKKFQIGVRSRVQLRETLQKTDELTQLESQVRTLRVGIAGYALVPELKYLIQFAFGANDFETGNSSPIFDAFVEYTKARDLNVRVGQFFVPFDRARTIREFALQFVDRQGVVRELTLDRDVGIMLSSQDLFGWQSRLAYHLFVGGGDGKNRVADLKNKYGPQTPGVLVVGRLIARPFGAFDDDQEGDVTRSATPHLALGVAAAYNISSDRDHSTYGNTYTLGTFNYKHAAADLVFKWRGFSLLTEVLYRKANTETHTGTVAMQPVTERSRSGYGYFAQAGQMVTSKLEIAVRGEKLWGTDRALKQVAKLTGRQVGGGLNLYLNGHSFKLQTDYFYVFGDDFSKGGHVARLQLDASF